MSLEIATLPLESGAKLGICAMPGRGGAYRQDLADILRWAPSMVLTMTTQLEMDRVGAGALGDDLKQAGVQWRHLPISDFRAPREDVAALWPAVSAEALAILGAGGSVLAHCYGGCGRSGMALLRLMVEAGEAPELALKRLRAVRLCAVETGEQFDWASAARRPGADG